MQKEIGAIPALIGFVLGIWLAIPNEANLGAIIARAILEISEPGSVAYRINQNLLLACVLLGVVIMLVTGGHIIQKFREGKLF